jgi:hypothetical protein
MSDQFEFQVGDEVRREADDGSFEYTGTIVRLNATRFHHHVVTKDGSDKNRAPISALRLIRRPSAAGEFYDKQPDDDDLPKTLPAGAKWDSAKKADGGTELYGMVGEFLAEATLAHSSDFGGLRYREGGTGYHQVAPYMVDWPSVRRPSASPEESCLGFRKGARVQHSVTSRFGAVVCLDPKRPDSCLMVCFDNGTMSALASNLIHADGSTKPEPKAEERKSPAKPDPYANIAERAGTAGFSIWLETQAPGLKREQALALLSRPLSTVIVGSSHDWRGKTVELTHPAWWPEDSGEEL